MRCMAAAGWGVAATVAYILYRTSGCYRAFTAAFAGYRCCQLLLLAAASIKAVNNVSETVFRIYRSLHVSESSNLALPSMAQSLADLRIYRCLQLFTLNLAISTTAQR